MKVDALASNGHYLANLRPIWDALPDDLRGDLYVPKTHLRDPGMETAKQLRDIRTSTNLVLCASNADAHRAPGRSILIEHGAGQSYGGDPIGSRNSAYSGGEDRDGNVLFLAVNETAAARDRARYPTIPVEIIGSPYFATLQGLPAAHRSGKTTVAITAHWNCPIAREAGSAWGPFRDAFATLARRDDLDVIGTAHPRIYREMVPHYQRMGIEPVEHLETVIERADAVIFDNTSAGFLAAACGLPVVLLDAPWWDPNVVHGGRFWDWADIGPRICAVPDPDENAANLSTAVDATLNTRPWPGAEETIDRIFPPIEDPAGHAAKTIAGFVAAGQAKRRAS